MPVVIIWFPLFEFAKYTVQNFSMVFALLTGFPVPLPGSRLFNILQSIPAVRDKYQGDLEKDDVFDYEHLVRLQTEHLTECSFELLRDYIDKTSKLSPRAGGFGLTG